MAGFHDDPKANDEEWDQLLGLVATHRCVPFLGAGACYPHLPLGSDLARQLAAALPEYPWPNEEDLMRAAQYAAVMRMPIWVKQWVVDQIRRVTPPAQQPAGGPAAEPHRVLAGLPIRLYMTTNYDEFMLAALRANVFRNPRLELCRWNPLLRDVRSVFEDPKFEMHVATPVVFHLHGHVDRPDSLVLTEDDYLEFLAAMLGGADRLIPEPVAAHLRQASLLFIGYRLADWNFRLLLRSLKAYALAANYLVLRPPAGAGAAQVRKYLGEFYGALNLRLYWGTAQEFAADLAARRADTP